MDWGAASSRLLRKLSGQKQMKKRGYSNARCLSSFIQSTPCPEDALSSSLPSDSVSLQAPSLLIMTPNSLCFTVYSLPEVCGFPPPETQLFKSRGLQKDLERERGSLCEGHKALARGEIVPGAYSGSPHELQTSEPKGTGQKPGDSMVWLGLPKAIGLWANTVQFSHAVVSDSLHPHELHAACQASLSITNSQSPPKPLSIESLMLSNHLILCHPLLLLPRIPLRIRVFSNESTLRIRWPKYWSFSFNISASNEHPGLISFRMDWLDLLAVQGPLKSLLQHHTSKASIL